jgi:hypothetical protein
MIIVKLMGGLGNQMFQYAAARSLALARNTTLKLDTSFLLDQTIRENFTLRKYELDAFILNANIAKPEEIEKYFKRPVSSGGFDKLLNRLSPHYNYFENQFNFNPEVLELPKNTYLDGYFQSEKYFIDYKYQIINYFNFRSMPDESNQKLINEISRANSVAIHIRRGDFVSNAAINQYHGLCSINYYLQGINYLKSKLKNLVFYVFSDEMNWVKLNFNQAIDLNFVEINGIENGSADLRLMTFCKHHIIANSSFSWWGAWLSQNPNKIIITPQKWFVSNERNYEDVVPESWIKL